MSTIDLGASPDPIASYRWAVWLGGYLDGFIAGWFTECSGLEIERTVKVVTEGGVNDRVHYLPGQVQRGSITLRRGVADATLWNWFSRYMYAGNVDRHTVLILLFDTAGNLTWYWPLPDAVPVQWQGPDLKADVNQVGVESLTIGQGGSAHTERAAQQKKKKKKLKGEVDRDALARKAYDLLRAELQIEKERRGGRW